MPPHLDMSRVDLTKAVPSQGIVIEAGDTDFILRLVNVDAPGGTNFHFLCKQSVPPVQVGETLDIHLIITRKPD